MSAAHALPELEHVTNFRELGGLATRDGRRVRRRRLFRSSHWGQASAADVDVLRELGVTLVIDFRSENDVSIEGADRLPDGTRHVSLATSDPATGTDIRVLIAEANLDELRERFGDGRAHTPT